MLATVLAVLVLAAAAPAIDRALGRCGPWLLAAVPAGIGGWYLAQLPTIASGAVMAERVPWVPSLGVDLAVLLDGLSLLFALLILGIGALVVAYAGAYMEGRSDRGRFLAFLLAFMGSMLGLVLADDVVVLFVFWELTSVTSYLLIGFDHADPRARRNALQALLVTGGGGLAMLAGFVLAAAAGGTTAVSVLTDGRDVLRASPAYPAMLALFALGAFTKSAQVPFHFWLPNAMVAPTPVSAYLHSATMVKAGLYLLARFTPALGGTEAWFWTLAAVGTATMLTGAARAVRQTDLKLVLAHTTTMALGALTLMLGLGHRYALQAFAVFLVVHAFYKGGLFMLAGAVDHETGTRDVHRLGGLARAMPITTTAAVLAGLGMIGMPPMFGFIGKESVYEAALTAHAAPALWLVAAVGANALTVVAAGMVAWGPFFGPAPRGEDAPHGHEPPLGLWLGPLVLGVLGLAFGVFHEQLAQPLLHPKVAAIAAEPLPLTLHLWGGLTPPLFASMVTLALGIAGFRGRARLAAFGGALARVHRIDCERGYDATLAGLVRLAAWQTRTIQSGGLRDYLAVVFAAFAAAVLGTLWAADGVRLPAGMPDVRFQEWAVAGCIAGGALATVRVRPRLAPVATVGIVGYGVGLAFAIFGAPDLAYTQFMAETLAVVILMLVLTRRPTAPRLERSPAVRRRDAAIAVACGAAVTLALWSVTAAPLDPRLTAWFAAESYLAGHGRNIVNVILVDFRGLDTMGEITVVALGGLVAVLLLGGPRRRSAGPIASVILATVTRVVFAAILLFSVWVMLRGHNEPGGGFIGGLLAASAFALYAFAAGARAARRVLRVDPIVVAGAGVATAVLSALPAVAAGRPFMTGLWWFPDLGVDAKVALGTPLLFDAGVYLAVAGTMLAVTFSLLEE